MKSIKLLKEHTHAGHVHPIGTVLTVPRYTAEYMEQHGIGKPIKQTSKKENPK